MRKTITALLATLVVLFANARVALADIAGPGYLPDSGNGLLSIGALVVAVIALGAIALFLLGRKRG